jgi:hypothetical protein
VVAQSEHRNVTPESEAAQTLLGPVPSSRPPAHLRSLPSVRRPACPPRAIPSSELRGRTAARRTTGGCSGRAGGVPPWRIQRARARGNTAEHASAGDVPTQQRVTGHDSCRPRLLQPASSFAAVSCTIKDCWIHFEALLGRMVYSNRWFQLANHPSLALWPQDRQLKTPANIP